MNDEHMDRWSFESRESTRPAPRRRPRPAAGFNPGGFFAERIAARAADADAPRLTHLSPAAVVDRVRTDRGGFLTSTDLAALANHPTSRLWPVLVRCGGGRFSCPAQDAAHFVEIITRDGKDYVRDCSLVDHEALR